MKRIGYVNGVKLYDAIRSWENVALAVRSSCKQHPRDPTVVKMKLNPLPYIVAAKQILDDESFHWSRFITKEIFERGKWRHLCYTRTFPDRVIQHAVMQIIGPILMAGCISTSYASREGVGIHRGAKRVQRGLRRMEGKTYTGKGDVEKFFNRVPRERLWEKLKRKLKCRRTLEILHRMIFEAPESGLLIGLLISQILSTFYLFAFDHYAKEILRIKEYHRYADDYTVTHESKLKTHFYMRHLKAFLEREGLRVKGNWQVFPTEVRGVDFLGFVIRRDFMLLRKRVKVAYIRSTNRIVKAVKHSEPVDAHMMDSEQSRRSMAEWCDSNHLLQIHFGRMDRALAIGPEAI